MQHLARIAAEHVPSWEVIEYGKAEKPDVPSGTARELAELLGTVRRPTPPVADAGLIGPPEARGALFGGARVHSLRLPGNPIAVEVHFGLPGERLVLRHDRSPTRASSCTARCSRRGTSRSTGPRARARRAPVQLTRARRAAISAATTSEAAMPSDHAVSAPSRVAPSQSTAQKAA